VGVVRCNLDAAYMLQRRVHVFDGGTQTPASSAMLSRSRHVEIVAFAAAQPASHCIGMITGPVVRQSMQPAHQVTSSLTVHAS